MYGVVAAKAYARSASHRGLRQQEADVFLRVNAVLRGAMGGDAMAVTKALADNDRLWTSVVDLVRDPENKLPDRLRASIVSVALSVQRETARDTPDIRFLIGINEQLAAGLSGL